MVRDNDVYEIKLKLYPREIVWFTESLGYRMMRAASSNMASCDVGYGVEWSAVLAWNLAIAALLGKAADRGARLQLQETKIQIGSPDDVEVAYRSLKCGGWLPLVLKGMLYRDARVVAMEKLTPRPLHLVTIQHRGLASPV